MIPKMRGGPPFGIRDEAPMTFPGSSTIRGDQPVTGHRLRGSSIHPTFSDGASTSHDGIPQWWELPDSTPAWKLDIYWEHGGWNRGLLLPLLG